MFVPERALTNGLAGKMKKKNFKIRRRSQSANMGFNLNLNYGTVAILFLTLVAMFDFVICESENDVLTLQDDLDQLVVKEEAADRRRPANDQEKDILLLDALGRRKGSYAHNSYSSSQEDDSIMDLLGKSKYQCALKFLFQPNWRIFVCLNKQTFRPLYRSHGHS